MGIRLLPGTARRTGEKSNGRKAGIATAFVLLAAVAALGACSGESGSSAVYFVDAGKDAGGDGTCWETAFTHPEDALEAASHGDEIWVAEGIYAPVQQSGKAVVRLAAGVSLLGGFSGIEEHSFQRDPADHPTVLDGRGIAHHVVVGAEGAVLDGFTVTGGKADGDQAQSLYGGTFKGGGMFNAGVSPEIRNCVFTGNEADSGGGAIYNEFNSVLIENCTFTHNRALFGGAVENRESHTVIVNSLFQHNESEVSGGGVANFGGSSRFLNAVFSGNRADYAGGGVLGNGSDDLFSNCSFTGNQAGLEGGGISMWQGRVTMTNGILWDNPACDGTGLAGPESDITVSYSIVQGGYAGAENLDVLPEFVNGGYWTEDGQWVDGDYRLASSSPAIDSGTGEGAPDYDADYNPRPQALAHDRGAYERSEP